MINNPVGYNSPPMQYLSKNPEKSVKPENLRLIKEESKK